MENSDNILLNLCNRENGSDIFNIEINGIPIYYYFRRYTHNEVLKLHNLGEAAKQPTVGIWEYRSTIVKSLFQLIGLLLFRKRYDNFVYSFYRTEMVDGTYLDKFTDPLIDESNVGDSYIIFEQGRAGRHLRPRLHQNKVIYADAIYWLGSKLWKRKKNEYARRNKDSIEKLYVELVKTFPEVKYDKDAIIRILVKIDLYQKFFSYIFKTIHAINFIAPSRADFIHLIPTAKQNNMRVLELQHGVTYGETLTYSGFFHPLFSPDYFLTFGKIHSAKCYGISEDKVVEIGWAFEKYLKKQIQNTDEKLSVLVVSSPDISDKMVNITCEFASHHPQILFYFRPHPNEQLDSQRLERLKSLPNVRIDNNLENVMVALMRFDNVMGENSTVLYEALSMGKKVGKLNLCGLTPRYLKEEDKACFYEITGAESFASFMNSPIDDGKPKMGIYSKFDSNAINRLL